ncbi:MAG: hypothetical protein ACOY6K_10040 [Pseudomonadota bacterium]
MTETGRSYSTTLPADQVAVILAAPAIAEHIVASKADDDFSRFDALRQHSRGLNLITTTAAQKKAAKARSNFSIEL